ncbi:MAG: ATP-binding protein [Myxococcota bacterium]
MTMVPPETGRRQHLHVMPSRAAAARVQKGWPRAYRAVAVLLAFVTQVSVVWLGYDLAGPSVCAFAGLPVAGAALLFGLRAGLAAIAAAALLDVLILSLMTRPPMHGLWGELPGVMLGLLLVLGIHRAQANLARLSASKSRLKAVLGCAQGAVFEFDENGRYLSVWTDNDNVLAKPPTELLGRTVTEVIPGAQGEELMQLLRKALETGGPVSLEYQLAVIGGQRWFVADAVRMVSDDGNRTTVAAIVRDITERKQLMSQAVLADRVDGLGMTAASVAHELNNPLTYIHANIVFVMEALGLLAPANGRHSEILQALTDAREGAERAEAIVRDLRTFSRTDTTVEDVDVVAVVTSALKMAAHIVSERASLSRHIEPVPMVRGSPAKLGQVLLNLLRNAAHAIPIGSREDHEVAVTVSAEDGVVRIEVRDTGAGIPPALQERIFEPFFTTKAPGEGTGLGLFVSKRIVEEMGGSLEVESPGRGAVFRVVLPAAPAMRTTQTKDMPASTAIRPGVGSHRQHGRRTTPAA